MKNPTLNFLQSLILLSVLLITAPVFSQLSGTYTLGDANSDFLTFSDAAYEIKSQGLEGNVNFLVKPGTYYNVYISNIENPEKFEINFSYDGTENDSALIIGRLKVFKSHFVSFNGFSIYTEENNNKSCVVIEESDFFRIENCKIIDLFNNNYLYGEGLILVDFPTGGPILLNYDVFLNNCIIASEENTIYLLGSKGTMYLESCLMFGHIEEGVAGRKKNYNNNTFHLNDNDFKNTSQNFNNNIFYSDQNYLKIRGNFRNNEFHTECEINVDNYLYFNTFFDDVDLDRGESVKVIENTFYKEFQTTFGSSIRFINNIFIDNVNIHSQYSFFGNNSFYDTVSITHGPGYSIHNNNFAQDAYLETLFTSGTIQNNNLGNLMIVQPTVWKVIDNNFVNMGNGNVNNYGENAYFYDPTYLNINGLYASNPLLIGKGTEVKSIINYDIDSVLRKEPCTIGANEICFDWQVNEIDLKCSDSLQLDLCLDTLENMYWSPSYLFDDSTSTNPLIFPEDSSTIYLHENNGTVIDSLIINPSAIVPIAFATYETEGLTVQFTNKSACASTYLWNFGDGGTSTEDSPTHTYETGGSYQCTLMASNYLGNAYWAALFDLVSINENSYKNNPFVVYPNPTNNSVLVKSNNNLHSLTILNVYGQLMYSKKLKGCKQHKTDISSFPKGIYFIRVQTSGATSNTVSTKSIIKN